MKLNWDVGVITHVQIDDNKVIVNYNNKQISFKRTLCLRLPEVGDKIEVSDDLIFINYKYIQFESKDLLIDFGIIPEWMKEPS